MHGIEALVPSIYGAALGRLGWSEVMADLAAGVGARHACISMLGNKPLADEMHTAGYDELLDDYLGSGWYDADPRNVEIARMTSGRMRPRVISDAYVRRRSPDALDRLREAFTAPRGYGDYATTMLHFGGKTAMLGFIRGSDADFSAADLRAVSAIGGHLEASLSLAERTSPPSDVSTLVAAYEETGATALFLSGRRRVIATTKAASTLIGDEVALIDGRLTFRSAGNQAAYEELLAEPPDAGSIKRMTLGDTASLLVHASSLADGGTKGPGSIETVLSFVSLEPTADEVARVETALIGMSLAPAEARVAAVVGSGAAPAEAASTLALTELTVRSYLKRAYWKLGITRQSELVLLCGRIRHL